MLITELHIVSTILYGISAVLFGRYFATKSRAVVRYANGSLWIGLALHTGMLVLFTVKRGFLPLGQFGEAATTFAWILGLLYLIQQYLLREEEFGVFVVSLVTIVQLISAIAIDYSRPLADVLQNLVFEIHVISMLFAYASFTLGFIAALMYLLLYHDIHGQRFGLFYSRLPSLEFLDKLNIRSVLIGLLLLTFGIFLGVVNASKAWGFFWEWDPKLTIVFINWVVYLYFAISHWMFGWRGQRTAVLSIIGFAVFVISFFLVTNFTSTIHTF